MEKLLYFTGDIALVDNLSIENCMAIQEPLKKLHNYEIAEEQGLLVKGDDIRKMAVHERRKGIDDFVTEAMKKFTEFDLQHGYPTVADCKTILRDLAEQMSTGRTKEDVK